MLALSIQKRHPQPETMASRVVRLMPRLQNAARGLHNTTSRVIDDDDLAQSMAVVLLEHEYLNVDGYCVRFARKRAIGKLRGDSTYRRYVAPMPEPLGHDDELLSYEDILPAAGPNPEEALIAKQERQAFLARLSPAQRRVLDLLAAGYKKGEIAAELGVSAPRVSQHLEAIRRAMEMEAA